MTRPDRATAPRPTTATLAVLALVLLALAGCGSTPRAAADPTLTVDGRSFTVHEPKGYDPERAVALVVGLHGYTSNSTELASYFGLRTASDRRGFLLALPEGLTDPKGDQYWSAVEGGCCDFYSARNDDSTWLSHVVETLRSDYRIDRVAVVGHSNGGFMAHRFACDHADQVDAIASLAGPLSDDLTRCRPARPVTVLHMHGDADEVVAYDGGPHLSSALGTAEAWAGFDGCTATPRDGAGLDLAGDLDGAETSVRVWDQGCRDGSSVQLWTVAGGSHAPSFTPAFTTDMLDVVLGPTS
jgi:polyhydroxybutyrate depolymerase